VQTLVVTHALVPSPVSAHEITILSFSILEVTVWSVVDTQGKLRVCKDVVDDLPGVAVPELVFGAHPLWYSATLRTEPLVLDSVRFPWDVSRSNCVNL
jgi:hypothetical protein